MAPIPTAATLDASLGPNLVDISKHLYALFPPEFVQAFPDAQIEIAYGLPERGPEAARLFNAVGGMEAAAAFAYARSKAACNCYVGPSLRKADLKSTRRAGKANVTQTVFAWCDFDGEGDEIRVRNLLKTANLQPAVLVQTGTIPCVRFQIYFHLAQPLPALNVEPVNAALRSWLGGDDVHNADRVMRLAGTLSYPNSDKVGRGYLIERTALKLVPNAPRYAAETLLKAAGVHRLYADGWGTPDEISRPPTNGHDRTVPYLAYAAETEPKSRSLEQIEALLETTRIKGQWHNNMRSVTSSLAWRGWPRDAMQSKCGRYCDHGPNDPELLELIDTAIEKYGKGTIDPVTVRSRSYSSEQIKNEEKQPPIEARPYEPVDPQTLPCREWLYGRQLIRKYVSATFAASGVGKTSVFIVEALAMTTGRPLLGVKVPAPIKVWLWNGEDTYDELQKRVEAARLHYQIDAAELRGRLFVNSGRDNGLIIARQTRNGVEIMAPVVDAMIATIRANGIDAVQIDPFISSHRVTENDNMAIDAVAKTWCQIADETGAGIDLAHHIRKLSGGIEATVEDGRGAVALLNAVRPARIINRMSEEEAREIGITDGRHRYLKVGDGKNNLALPSDKVTWLRLNSVCLGNGERFSTDHPDINPDDSEWIGVVTAWQLPDPFEGVTGSDFTKVAALIRVGEWRADVQARSGWVGLAVAQALGLSVADPVDNAKIKGLIKGWIKSGSLVEVRRLDPKQRKTKPYVEVADEAD